MWYRNFDPFLKGRAGVRYSRVVVFGTASVLLSLVLWAGLATMDKVVRAEGRIIPADKSQLIQHLEGGVVNEIAVSEGQTVKRGDLLMRIGDQLGSSGLNENRVRETALRAKFERLLAESKGAADMVFSKAVASTDAAKAEQANFYARREASRQEVNIIQQQIAQRKAEITEQESRGQELRKEASLENKKLAFLTGLVEQGAASQLELLDQQSKVQRFQSQIRETEVVLPKLRSSIAEFEGRLSEAKNRFQTEVRAELSATQLELARVMEGIVAGADRVQRAEIRAPVTGIVNRIHVSTLGGVIRPGETVVEITPIEDKLVVEARVLPADRAELHPGLRSKVRLSAYDFGLYGSVPGQLSEISADTLADERGERFYRVKINLDLANSPFADKPVLPGMTVSADIVTGKRPVLAFFLSRFLRFSQNAFSEAG